MTKKFANHPILFEECFFTRSVVIAIPGYHNGGGMPDASPENHIEVQKIDGEEHRYVGIMRTIINPDERDSFPYHIEMECVGTFSTDDSLSEEDANRGVLITAHSVLYGAIRESIAWLTGRQPNGQLMVGLSILRSLKDTETETKVPKEESKRKRHKDSLK